MNDLFFTEIESPVGILTLAGTKTALTGLYFADHSKPHTAREGVRDPAPFEDIVTQLHEYFEGRRSAFDVTLSPRGTPFQLRVWAALRAIPYGHTVSYGDIAREIGNPTASRAVGAANGLNPISIIVPCHRVIGKDGSLTGYAGGTARKEWLLCRESAHPSGQGRAKPERLLFREIAHASHAHHDG